jgi:DNA-binding MarR family transcriptional regulator
MSDEKFSSDTFENAPLTQATAAQNVADKISGRLRVLEAESQRAATVSSDGFGRNGREVGSFAVRRHLDESMDSNLQMDVRRARKLRQLRKRIFGKQMFSGPGWEILLHLFEVHLSQLCDTVGKICIGTELPGATVVRWIGRLEQERLVSLRDDQFDGRRRFVELTDSGIRLMTSYFAGAAPHQIKA